MAPNHELDCLLKKMDCSVVVKVKVTEEVQNSSKCSSGPYLISCGTFCNQTWYGDASSWAGVVQEDCFAVFKFRVTVRAHIIRYDSFYHICCIDDLSATKFNWIVHHHELEHFV